MDAVVILFSQSGLSINFAYACSKVKQLCMKSVAPALCYIKKRKKEIVVRLISVYT